MSANREFYKKPLGLIPFYIPHAGCPQQCIFCNQHRIASDGVLAVQSDIRKTIKDYVGTKRQEKYWEVAFYGGSFTALPVSLQEQLLEPAYEALQSGEIDGIRCSTRPDALGQEAIDRIKAYDIDTVEIGVQSMDDAILLRSKRGHTAADVVDAVGRLKDNGLRVGIQLLPGLPGESWHTLVNTAVQIGRLKPDFGRIYPVLVIEDTELAEQTKAGLYTPLSVEQAVAYSAFLKTYLEGKGIYIIRTGLQSTEELDEGVSLVGGPYEPAMGEMVINHQWRLRIENLVRTLVANEGRMEHNESSDYIESNENVSDCDTMTCIEDRIIRITYPRSLTSKVRGLKKSNMKYFKESYPLLQWHWVEDNTVPDTHVMVLWKHLSYVL